VPGTADSRQARLKMMRMRILIVPGVDWFTALENRIHHFTRFWRRQHETHVIHISLGGQPIRGNEGDEIHRIRNFRSGGLLTYYLANFLPQMVQILAVMRREEIELVVTNGLSAGTAAIIVAKISDTPIIFDYSDYLPAFSRYTGMSGIVERLLRWVGELVTTFNLRVADASVAIGKKLRRHSQCYSTIFHQIPNGVDGSRFREVKRQPGSVPTVGYVGVLEFFVDLESAIKSLQLVPGVDLVVVGDGRERERLVAISNDLGLEDRIEFVGRVPYEEVPGWMASMDVCLLPFLRNDLTEAALPLKIHEYAACRRPIISTALFEVVRMYGDLVVHAEGSGQIASGILEILENRKATLKRTRRAYLRSTMTYDWRRLADRYEKVFGRILT